MAEPAGRSSRERELGDVGQHVAVAEHDAFRLAGGAGGEEQRGLVIAAAFVETEQSHRGSGWAAAWKQSPR